MKITNDFGNKLKGSIGNQVTASEWNGRNYLKAYSRPSNPSTPQQETKRDWIRTGTARWQTLIDRQKAAYVVKEVYHKFNVSPFNAFMKYWLERKALGLGYTNPVNFTLQIRDSVTTNLIPGAKVVVKRAGETIVYETYYQTPTAPMYRSDIKEDENYDFYYSKEGYNDNQSLDKGAGFNHRTINLVPL